MSGYNGVVRGVRMSDDWDLDGDVLVHYRRNSQYPDMYDARACCKHETEVVHHGYIDIDAVRHLILENAGPDVVAFAIRSAHDARIESEWRQNNPPPPPVAAVLSHGREVRLVDGQYEVQPHNDNYWCKFDTLEDAIAFGEGDKRG